MQLKTITIRNFKAIHETTLSLANMTVIVGTNGSGKSSVLQALHWMFQSGRNQSVGANAVKDLDFKKSDGSTLSEKTQHICRRPNTEMQVTVQNTETSKIALKWKSK